MNLVSMLTNLKEECRRGTKNGISIKNGNTKINKCRKILYFCQNVVTVLKHKRENKNIQMD